MVFPNTYFSFSCLLFPILLFLLSSASYYSLSPVFSVLFSFSLLGLPSGYQFFFMSDYSDFRSILFLLLRFVFGFPWVFIYFLSWILFAFFFMDVICFLNKMKTYNLSYLLV
uniref:Uncharacterized protein n=1 Tax=Cacopsylla melanoneura TaxID=428564 RepID=A0A8D8RA16_9HEMI